MYKYSAIFAHKVQRGVLFSLGTIVKYNNAIFVAVQALVTIVLLSLVFCMYSSASFRYNGAIFFGLNSSVQSLGNGNSRQERDWAKDPPH